MPEVTIRGRQSTVELEKDAVIRVERTERVDKLVERGWIDIIEVHPDETLLGVDYGAGDADRAEPGEVVAVSRRRGSRLRKSVHPSDAGDSETASSDEDGSRSEVDHDVSEVESDWRDG